MIRKLLFALIIFCLSAATGISQSFVKTSELFRKQKAYPSEGRLNIIQDPSIDTLISRYILVNKNLYDNYSYFGMEGWRIQIYSSSNRNAKDESSKAQADFINKFKNIHSYQLFAKPAYWKIRVGDFRTKAEATKIFLLISKEFPDVYLVPDFIYFPDLNKE
jgi:hypothetical protein